MRIFITGGAGYIGSHTLLDVLQNSHEALVYDNYCNSSEVALDRVARLTNAEFTRVEGDVRDPSSLSKAMEAFKPDVVLHFAGLKAVGESVENPLSYYDNNVSGSIALLNAMDKIGCKHIVFSSTATVYGDPQYLPYDEKHPLKPESPYGRTKLMVEEIIRDWSNVDAKRSAVLLRYFNPVGAHQSAILGEDPFGIPNNLMPFVQQVAVGRREKLIVHGNDYDTRDGTGIRDYIHIEDLADAHVKAAEYVKTINETEAFNIGTGRGCSVLEVLQSFEKAAGKPIPYEIGPRRAGDIAEFYASSELARQKLGWAAKHDLEDMTRSAWAFQSQNPNGYEGES